MASKDIVANAIAALDNFAVKLRNFIMLARDKKLVICVFEGDDHYYYGPRIDAHIPALRQRRNFPMGGKGNVLELYRLRSINKDVGNAAALYFTDRDYDFAVPATLSRLYVTPCYSIENFYLGEAVFSRILCDAFKIPVSVISEKGEYPNDAFEAVVKWYGQSMLDIHVKYLVPLSGFIIAARESLVTQPILRKESQLCIQDLNTNEYFLADGNKISPGKSMTIQNLSHSLKAHGLVSAEKHKEKCDFLMKTDFVGSCRGKYSFLAFTSLMEMIWSDSKKTNPKIFKNKQDAKVSFSKNTALADLSSYAETPECLRQFLRNELATI
jgi:hypothetical protein